MRNFRIFLGIILLSIWAFSGCNENVSDPVVNQGSLSKIVHRVSVGGCDITPPGWDRNFSLVATINSEGEVSGQWQDGWGGGSGGIHVAVDCLVIEGNKAIVGGVVTHGSLSGIDLTGTRAVTMVVDNGEGQNADPDQISFSWTTPPSNTIGTCGDYTFEDFEEFYLFDLTCGQVQVK